MASWWQMYFLDGASNAMFHLIGFHDWVMFMLIIICAFVMWLLAETFFMPWWTPKPNVQHSSEYTWTMVPGFALMVGGLPALRLLFMMEEQSMIHDISVKVTGRQWYWNYEYTDFSGLAFDSYMLPEDELSLGMFRLLDVDHRTVLPANLNIRFLLSAADVLHAWALPSLGLKMDAVPGRLNTLYFTFFRTGLYYGQCSEICGANHSFMPISLEVVPTEDFLGWAVLNSE